MWHYRIFKVINKKTKKHFYCIKEFFPKVPVGKYIGKKEKLISLWTKNPIEPFAETKKGLIQCLKCMLKDALHYKTKIEYLNNEEYEKICNKSF